MKLKGGQIEGFLRAPDPATRAILVFGPDEGLVRERALRLAKTAVEDLRDPFRVVQLSPTDLKNDPARLNDEAAALSMGGGPRVVWVRQANDTCTPACQALLQLDTPMGALVVIDGGDLNPRSKLRKLFETAKNAVCVPCYADDQRSLPAVIRESLQRSGLTADPAAMNALVQNLGRDRSVTRSELGKLALYMGEGKQVSAEDVSAAIGDSAASGVDDVIYSAASGERERLETALTRVLAEGTQAVQLVRAAQRHFQRLHLVRGHMAQGQNPDQATRALRPPLMFKLADAFKRQLSLWPEAKLARAFEILTEAEMECKTTGLPAATLCSRAFMSLAHAARSAHRRP